MFELLVPIYSSVASVVLWDHQWCLLLSTSVLPSVSILMEKLRLGYTSRDVTFMSLGGQGPGSHFWVLSTSHSWIVLVTDDNGVFPLSYKVKVQGLVGDGGRTVSFLVKITATTWVNAVLKEMLSRPISPKTVTSQKLPLPPVLARPEALEWPDLYKGSTTDA